MYNLYERIQSACASKGLTVSAMCLNLGMSKSVMSDLKSGRKKSLSSDTVAKIAEYLDVSSDYLLGIEETPTTKGERSVKKDDVIFALFRGRYDITDAMYEEVLNFADFVVQREDAKKKKDD